MLRLVKTLDGGPAYFLLCDHRQCMEARNGIASIANPDDFRLARDQFLKAAAGEGWWIDLEGAYCPAHAREMLYAARQAEERARQIVTPAQPGQVLAFGKAR